MPDKRLKIRLANLADAPIIALLGRVTFRQTFGHLFNDPQDLLNYLERTFAIGKIKTSLQKSDNQFWVAHLGELPVAYAKIKWKSKAPLKNTLVGVQLQKIYVLADFLQDGIGKRLFNDIEQHIRQQNHELIWLSVLHTNDRAIRFYKKLGFQSEGHHDFSIGKEDFHFNILTKN